jgi:hypothetical protein
LHSTQAISLLITTAFVVGSIGCGEPYRNEGDKLNEEINKELIAQKLCNSTRECNQIFRASSSHGNQLNYSVYAPDKLVLATAFKVVIEKGMEITNGVPISIKVYPKTREEYGNNPFYTSIITLEIKQ